MRLIVVHMKSPGVTTSLPFLLRGASVIHKSPVILISVAEMVPIAISELACYCTFAVESEVESGWQFCAPEGQKEKGNEFSLGMDTKPDLDL